MKKKKKKKHKNIIMFKIVLALCCLINSIIYRYQFSACDMTGEKFYFDIAVPLRKSKTQTTQRISQTQFETQLEKLSLLIERHRDGVTRQFICMNISTTISHLIDFRNKVASMFPAQPQLLSRATKKIQKNKVIQMLYKLNRRERVRKRTKERGRE